MNSTRFTALAIPLALASLLAASQRQAAAQQGAPNMRAEAEQIVALANQARAQAGVDSLHWDNALAAAALAHCQRMVQEGPISHRYNGEADLTERAARAGAHFSVIEENVAIGPSPSGLHQEWMNSPGHRANMLSPDVDSIGVAVLASRGVLYAVEDFGHAVQSMTPAQVEQQVAALIRPSGVTILQDSSLARAACPTNDGMPHAAPGSPQPRFIMRWQDGDLSHLPPALLDHLQSGNYRQAAVGSCSAQNQGGSFTSYRLAVLLY